MSTSTPTTTTQTATQTPLAAAATSIYPTLLQLDQSLNGNTTPNPPSPSSLFDPKADDVDVDPGIGNATSRSVPYDRVLVRVDERGPPNHYQHAQDSDPDSSFESSSGRDDMEEEAADEPKTRTSNQQQPQRRIKLNRIDSPPGSPSPSPSQAQPQSQAHAQAQLRFRQDVHPQPHSEPDQEPDQEPETQRLVGLGQTGMQTDGDIGGLSGSLKPQAQARARAGQQQEQQQEQLERRRRRSGSRAGGESELEDQPRSDSDSGSDSDEIGLREGMKVDSFDRRIGQSRIEKRPDSTHGHSKDRSVFSKGKGEKARGTDVCRPHVEHLDGRVLKDDQVKETDVHRPRVDSSDGRALQADQGKTDRRRLGISVERQVGSDEQRQKVQHRRVGLSGEQVIEDQTSAARRNALNTKAKTMLFGVSPLDSDDQTIDEEGRVVPVANVSSTLHRAPKSAYDSDDSFNGTPQPGQGRRPLKTTTMDSLLDESDDTSELQATPCPPQCRPVNLIPDNKKSSSSIPDVGQQRQQPLGPSHRSNFALTVQLGRSLQKQATPPPGPPTRPKQAEISLDASDFDLSSGGAAKNNSEDVHRHAYGRGSNQLSAPDDRSRMSVSRSIDSFGNTRSEPFTDGFTTFESSFASGVGTLLPRHEYAANRQVTSTPRDQYADVQVTPRDHSDRRRQSYDQQQHQHQEYRRDDRGGNRQSRHDQPRDKPSRHESQHVTSFFVRDQGLLLKIQTSTGKCIWPKQLSTTNRPGSWINYGRMLEKPLPRGMKWIRLETGACCNKCEEKALKGWVKSPASGYIAYVGCMVIVPLDFDPAKHPVPAQPGGCGQCKASNNGMQCALHPHNYVEEEQSISIRSSRHVEQEDRITVRPRHHRQHSRGFSFEPSSSSTPTRSTIRSTDIDTPRTATPAMRVDATPTPTSTQTGDRTVIEKNSALPHLDDLVSKIITGYRKHRSIPTFRICVAMSDQIHAYPELLHETVLLQWLDLCVEDGLGGPSGDAAREQLKGWTG